MIWRVRAALLKQALSRRNKDCMFTCPIPNPALLHVSRDHQMALWVLMKRERCQSFRSWWTDRAKSCYRWRSVSFAWAAEWANLRRIWTQPAKTSSNRRTWTLASRGTYERWRACANTHYCHFTYMIIRLAEVCQMRLNVFLHRCNHSQLYSI